MLRRRLPWWTTPVAVTTGSSTGVTYMNSGGSCEFSSLLTPVRGLKTLDVREYRPLATPIEFRFYQRYANHPNRQSGIQFLTHYNTHQRFRVNKDFIDYMNWGREQGQARLPHRHQRVAFDFNDALHPTVVDRTSKEWFSAQDASIGRHPDISSTFNPNKKLFSHPEHWNKMFSKRRPGEGDIDLSVLQSQSLLGPLTTQTDTQETAYFQMETRGPTHGKVPGINAPFLGEFDRKMMQAMSRPLNQDHTLTGNDGRFSKTIYMNDPSRNQCLSATLAKQLNVELDRATNAVYSKLTVLEAAQSGQTDYFCGGVDMEAVGFDMQMGAMLRARAQQVLSAEPQTSSTAASGHVSKEMHAAQELLRDSLRYRDRADEALREHAALIWRAYTAPRPFMTLVNGKAKGTGCGLSLAAKYCALKDSSELIFDGPNIGLTPYGGLTRLLARPETSLKFPGLAEFVMLTGTSLFAGDALRLRWTDLFTTLPDMSYHIKEWFDASEHMHNDAVAWQLGHLLESCFKMKDAHTSAMERCAITPTRARWIEDAFADQPSVESMLATLTEMERLPLTDPHNTCDANAQCATPFTISSVADGVQKLEEARLRYTLAPWDITPPEEEVVVRQAADIFTSYVLERRGTMGVVVHRDRSKLRRWREQREAEYHAYSELRTAPHPRHVYVRLEGCEGKLIDFDYVFSPLASHTSEELTTGVQALKSEVLKRLGMPIDREMQLGWYMPTLDTCPVHTDAQLLELLHADPGIEDPSTDLKYPPVYFIVKRSNMHLSEWAYAVKHQLLLQSPYALKATMELLKEVRGDGSAEAVQSLSDTLAIEFKYISRAMQRPDFYAIGQHTNKSPEQWEELKEEKDRNIHKSYLPTRPLPDFEEVFERDASIDGHTFQLRPRWHPRTLANVSQEEIQQLRAPLRFETDGVVSLDPSVHCAKADRLSGMIEDAGGLEVVAHLGEADADGKPKVAPLKSNARVPTNVNFYEMARHPWEDTPSSWRRDGLTEGSKAYFEEQYKAAEAAVYDEDGKGVRQYWPSKGAVEGTGAGEETGEALLEERLYGELRRAERGVEGWAKTLRGKAIEGKLDYTLEIASQHEKIYDDEYYRWFIQPGNNPNPSGLLIGRKNAAATSSVDMELKSFLNSMLSGATNTSVAAATDAEMDIPEDEENSPIQPQEED